MADLHGDPRRCLILPALALALGGLPVAAQEPGSGGQPEVASVDFQGNSVFPDDSLAAAIVNRETTCRTWIFRVVPLCPLGVDFALDRHYLVPREVSADSLRIKAYYFQRGYRETTVDTALSRVGDDGRVRLSFRIDEGRPVRVDSLSFTGVEEVQGDFDLLRSLPIRTGSPLSGILLDATRDTIVGRLRDHGYPHAYVLRDIFIPAETYGAEVDFGIDPGPRARFGRITVRSDTAGASLSETSIRRMLPFSEGDLYSKELVYQAQRNLFGLEIVRNASIDEDLDSEPDTLVPLTVRVAEGDAHRVRTLVGWSSSDCFSGEATWASRNFMGGARRLQVRGRVSNVLARDLNQSACPDTGEGIYAALNGIVSVELFQPWLFSTRNALTLSVFAERQSLPDVFVRKAVGLTSSLTRTLGGGTALTLSYRPQLTTLEDAADVYFCFSFQVCNPSDVGILEAGNWLSPLGATLSRNRTDDLLNPSDGYRLLLDLEHASSLTGSEFAYNRVITEGAWYQEMARRTIWAAHLRLGWVGGGEFGGLSLGGIDVIHPQKRFYAGGANSVRGFPQNRLGPRVLTVDVEDLLGYRSMDGTTLPPPCQPGSLTDPDNLTCDPGGLADRYFMPRPQGGTRMLEGTLEYRFAFGGEFQAVLFTDVGQVWAEGAALRIGDLEPSPGLGVRYFSPIGPIRMDVGYRFRGAEDLPVVTSLIRPYDPASDVPDDRIQVVGSDGTRTRIDWVRRRDLALLGPRVRFGGSESFLQHLQLHFSIGQAF